jgi:hypothetical protein
MFLGRHRPKGSRSGHKAGGWHAAAATVAPGAEPPAALADCRSSIPPVRHGLARAVGAGLCRGRGLTALPPFKVARAQAMALWRMRATFMTDATQGTVFVISTARDAIIAFLQ